ncbi:hypothetical protein [Bradyrhizobium sp.]|uniref:hypothetical protein n=1 Tax=Bradyrhizobium sp. TaxID=376 RepID=UPI0025C1917A|nr:hypothetical protein [Bradyrhizobium sp.]MBV8920845.1 hypothetical protein [Bradyrhizobium sp.]
MSGTQVASLSFLKTNAVPSDQGNIRTIARVPVRTVLNTGKARALCQKFSREGRDRQIVRFFLRAHIGTIILSCKILKTKKMLAHRFVTLPPDKAGYMSRLTGACPTFEEP